MPDAHLGPDRPGSDLAEQLRALADRIDGQSHFSPGHCQDLIADGKRVGWASVYDSPTFLLFE